MCPKKHVFLIMALLLILPLATACSEQEPVEVTRVVTVEVTSEPVEVEVTRIVEVPAEPAEGEAEPAEGEAEPEAEMAMVTIPFQEQWSNSPHADQEAEAFRHWDEDDPAEVPQSCAKCHSTPGYRDFVGADGTEAGVVDNPAPIGSVVECAACHNEATLNKTSVTFPSGVEITDLGAEARCMECHQGRASTQSVNESIVEAGLDPAADLDTVSEDLGFTNIHYYAAAATQYGTLVMGGFEYEGKSYDAQFDHVAPYDTCIECHDPHTLEVRLDECTSCHSGLNEVEDLQEVRSLGSLVDYDGDGDMDEGIYFEIEDMRATLYSAMQMYADEVAEAPIIYDTQSYPYFFNDTNNNGEIDEGESEYGNAFNAWTPRLAKAAYNYQVSLKDPGRFAHGGKYIIQLLYDSIEDLNQSLAEPIDMAGMRRIDHGHFAGSEEAFRHWDEDGFVPASCSKCHSADGLPFFLNEGVNVSQELSNGLDCTTCHENLDDFARHPVEEVTFPSGATLSTGDQDSNLCLNCHQGRESTTSVNALIGDLGPDEVGENLRFLNIHYFAAGATLFGGEAQGAYEYEGQTYMGRNTHVEQFDTCTECHDTHALTVEIEDCAVCHAGVEDIETVRAIRFNEAEEYVDFDGDGDTEEGIRGEIQTMQEALYAAMQNYAANTEGVDNIVYDSHSYPYYFIDTNGDGVADADEANFGNQFNTWTPTLLRAAYNYQYVSKDPGGYAHNGDYLIQVLYDSLVDLGGDTAGMTRPVTPTE